MNRKLYDEMITALNLTWAKCEDAANWKSSKGGRPGQRIKTPDGVFMSITDAAKFYDILPCSVFKKLKTHPADYYRIEADDEDNELFDLERKIVHPTPTVIDVKRLRKQKR